MCSNKGPLSRGNLRVKRGTTLQAANRAKSQRRVIHSTVIRLHDKIRDAIIGYLLGPSDGFFGPDTDMAGVKDR